MHIVESFGPKVAACLALATLLVTSGCGGNSWQARTYPVRGTITINGQAPKGAMIKLIKIGEPVDSRKSDAWAIVQDDGSYTFSTYDIGDGVPQGEYAWIMRWNANPMQMVPDKLGEQYWKPDEPYMTVDVDGPTELPPIELTEVKVSS